LLDKQEEFNNMRYYAESIVTTIRRLIILIKKLCTKTANASFYKKKFNTEEQDTEGKLFQNSSMG
jgi:hypothetical protein